MSGPQIYQKRGFTLTEVIVAVIIASVLMSFAIPKFTGTIERVRAAEGVQILTALLRAQVAYELETGGYTAVLANLDVEFPNADNFNLPPTVAAANPIASVTRTGGYRLSINDLGNITCANVGAITCATAGY